MAMVDTLQKNILGWGTLGMLLVVLLVVLTKFKTTGAVCQTGYSINVTANNCYLTTNASVTTTPTSITLIDNFVSGLSEPGNWVAIVVIALVGFGIVKLFSKKKSR